jgi:hypothetical protein
MNCAEKVYPDEAVYPTNCCDCKIVFHNYCWSQKDSFVEISTPIYVKKEDNTFELLTEKSYKKIEGYYNCLTCGHKLTTFTNEK